MKNLTHLAVPKDTAPRFPHNTIQNETATQDGTPVVRELYGDVLTNIWKIIQLTGITFTGDEDSDDTQYQLVDALRKFYNELNDVEQVLQGSGAVWRVNLDLAYLPNKFVFIGRADTDYLPSTNYQFKGIDNALLYPASSPTGFKANDEVLTIIDTSGVRMYNISGASSSEAHVFNILGAPLSFNDNPIMYYLSDGKIYTDKPEIYDVEQAIKTSESNNDLHVSDAIVYAGKLICLVFDSKNIGYHVFTFSLNDLTSPTECTYINFGVVSGVNNNVYMYCDGKNIFFSNEFNGSTTDFNVIKTIFSGATNELTLVSTIPLSNGSFSKTTNTVIINNKLYTFIQNNLISYDLTTLASVTVFDNYSLYVGNLFFFNKNVYFSRNEVAEPWEL